MASKDSASGGGMGSAPATKEKAIHPNSRVARRAIRSSARDLRLSKKKAQHDSAKTQPLLDKLMWFQANADRTATHLSAAQLHELIERYLHRNDEKLQELVRANSRIKGQRPKAKKEDDLRAEIDAERASYVKGTFEAPDLTTKRDTAILKEWTGEPRILDMIRVRTFAPPKAATAKAAAKAAPSTSSSSSSSSSSSGGAMSIESDSSSSASDGTPQAPS